MAIALTGGAGIPVALSAMVPPGVTAAFAPAEVVPPATSVLTLSVPASHSGTVSGGASIKGTSALGARYAFLPLEIRSPYRLTSPQDVVLEEGGLTALATEHDRVVRLDTLTGKVTRTIASGLAAGSEEPQQLVVEPGGATALVAAPGALRRVELATGELTDVATGLSQPHGVALESATHALVTDCGTSCATDGRVLRVDLGSGAVTEVATGLSRPRGIALESATHALVALTGSRQLVRVDLGSGATVPVAVDLPGDAQPFGAPSLTGPTDVAVEAGGRTALVLTSWLQAVVRVDLAVGTKTTVRSTGFSGYASGIAVEADGDSALLAESDRILRVPLDVPDHTVATARLSPDALYDARGVAPVSGSDDLLVTNVAPSLEGQLLRVDRATGVATRIPLVDGGATPVTLNSPQALALDRAGEVLVMEHDRISRVALASGLRTEVLPLPSWPNPIVGKGLAVVPQSFAVFTTDRNQEVRFLNLLENPPIATTLRSIPGVACCSGGVALPPGGGEFAYALRYAPTGGSGVLERISLMEGGAFRVADGFATPTGIAIEGDTHALVVESGAGGRVVRVDLVTGRRTIVAGALGAPRFLALEAGAALVAEGSRIARVATEGLALGPTFVATLNDPRAFVVEAGGATALVVDCQDGVACSSGGRLVRVDLQTGARTQLATAFNDPAGVALLDASTAIVTDCGPVGTYNCNANGRVLRVALGTGAVSQIVDGLNEPVGVAAEPGGTVLVAERGGGRVMRVWPSNGARQQVVSGLHGPDRIAVESGGASALVLEYSGISRVNIAARTAVKLASWQWGPFHGGGAFALEPDGERVLVIPGNGAGPTHPVPLGRVDLATGAHAVLSPGAFDSVRDLAVLDETQAIALERRVGSGALVRFTR